MVVRARRRLAFLETSAFVGLIAPGELAVVLGGVLAGRGQMEFRPCWRSSGRRPPPGTPAASCSAGARSPVPAPPRAPVRRQRARLSYVERFFARHGAKAFVVGRFVGIVRAMGPFTAGASRMRPGRFIAADAIGAGLWAAVIHRPGYPFADRLDNLLDALHQAQLGLGLALVAASSPRSSCAGAGGLDSEVCDC